MSPVYIFLLAVALAMDALAVAVGLSLKYKWVSFRQFFRLSFHFGLFQFLMPILGWTGGVRLERYIKDYDHWVAFFLLAFIGLKMIQESSSGREFVKSKDPTTGKWLVLLSLAVSMDALVVGLSLSLVSVSIWVPSVVIGVVAALFTLLGMYFGSLLKKRRTRYLETAGGLILIGIGIKILLDHKVF
ncbi:MAG TPA: manganese efflux pump MntP family protein [archaeon]|nr:manganese efflux pump MntP family protein [archaeon]